MELLRVELSKPRDSYPQEQLHPWLSSLLDIYYLVDVWTRLDIEQKEIGSKIKCQKGCSHCCKMLTIPINHLEFQGLCWYVSEIMPTEERKIIKSRLTIFSVNPDNEEPSCPFLIDDICIVYPLRPIACRQFFILKKPCVSGQNPWYKRREDIYCALNDDISWMIALKYFPIFGLHDEAVQLKAFQRGLLLESDRPLSSYSWQGLAKKII